MFSKLLFVVALVVACSCVVLERPPRSPKNKWTEVQRAAGSDSIKLGFSLKHTNLDKLHDLLLAVSTPGNSEYGHHRSPKVLRDMVKPKDASVKAVRTWLERTFSHDEIKNATETQELLTIDTTVAKAEALLNCQFYEYVYNADKDIKVTRVKMGTDYEVDSSVADHLYFVAPTHRFPAFRTPIVSPNTEAFRVTPDTIMDLYKTGGATGKSSTNKQGVAAFQGQYFDNRDTEDLWNAYNVPSAPLNRVPSNQNTGYGIESELDVQYITSTGRGIDMEHWYTGGFSFPNSLFTWSQDVLSTPGAPPLFSVSYGANEDFYGISFCTSFNAQLAMMGTAGISVLFASGDSGAGGDCSVAPFSPDYPASSPYVTAVGGVTGGNANENPIGESVWNLGGGGFSDYTGTQSWQTDAVSHYLSNSPNLPSSTAYNASGRGYPDIAAQSVDFVVYVRGSPIGVSGTSCSSPTSGGIFALLNDLRQQNGMSNMGFLNPFIYQTAAADSTAFNDCTKGSNDGCSLSDRAGFPAYSMWDAASGWGSPNYEVLSGYVMKTGEATKQWN